MPIYFSQDIEMDLSGDITMSGNGDIALASTTRSMFQQVGFRLRTDPSDYSPANTDVGANLGAFVGELVTDQVLDDMETQVKDSLTDDLFNEEDIDVSCFPIDDGEVLVYVKAEGLFLDSDGNEESNGFESIFSFPVFEGDAIELTSYQEG